MPRPVVTDEMRKQDYEMYHTENINPEYEEAMKKVKSKNLVDPKSSFGEGYTKEEVKLLGEWRKKHKKIRDDISDIFDELANMKLPASVKKEVNSISNEYSSGHEVGNVDFDSVKSRLLHILKPIPDKKSVSKDLIKEVEEVLEMVKSIKIPKKSKSPKHISKALDISEMIINTPKIKKGRKNTDNISMAMALVEMVHKTPKSKKISEKDIETVNDSIKEIDKLLKTPKKGLKKLIEADKEHLKFHPSKQDYKEMRMDQKAYKHKSKDVSELVSNYVEQFKSILSENKVRGGVMTKGIKDIRTKFYDKASPSEIDDANALIKQYRELLPPKQSSAPIPRAKKVKPDVNTYAGHIKYKK